MEDIKYCNRCGDKYFIEHLDEKGICKTCNNGFWRYTFNEQISNNEH